jgi:hypothetical protein
MAKCDKGGGTVRPKRKAKRKGARADSRMATGERGTADESQGPPWKTKERGERRLNNKPSGFGATNVDTLKVAHTDVDPVHVLGKSRRGGKASRKAKRKPELTSFQTSHFRRP